MINKNLILIGMSGAGKSTIGVLLAKAMNYSFVDTDLLIQKEDGRFLHEILNEDGVEAFKNIEEKVICQLDLEATVIATGGSVVYSRAGMTHLKEKGIVVFIDVPFEEIQRRIRNITTRGIVMAQGQDLESLHTERYDLYEQYSDLRLEVKNKTIEETVEALMALLQ